MITAISDVHKNRFEEIRKNLTSLGSKERSFLQVELLFYEAIAIAKAYGNDITQNALLAHLKHIQFEAYEKTKEVCKTSSQRERLIQRFVIQFKKALSGR